MIIRIRLRSRAAALWALALLIPSASLRAETLRPLAVPLVACDPYFSLWSPVDKLTDALDRQRTAHDGPGEG
jgi:hypothetical protein